MILSQSDGYEAVHVHISMEQFHMEYRVEDAFEGP